MAKGEPLSVRLTNATQQLVDAEARRTKRSRSSIVEAFTEETARARRFAGIGFRGEDARRRAWVVGSGLDVWEVVQMLDDYESVERLVADTQLTERQVRLALAYREHFPEDIDDAILDNRRSLDDLRLLYPFVALSDAER